METPEKEKKSFEFVPEDPDELGNLTFTLKALRTINDVCEQGERGGVIVINAHEDHLTAERVENYFNDLARDHTPCWVGRQSVLDVSEVKHATHLKLTDTQLEHSTVKAPVIVMDHANLLRTRLVSNEPIAVKRVAIEDIDYDASDEGGIRITNSPTGPMVERGLSKDDLNPTPEKDAPKKEVAPVTMTAIDSELEKEDEEEDEVSL